MSVSTDTIRARMRPTKPLIPLQAVAAAPRRSMPGPVLDKIGQKTMMLMTLTTCVQQDRVRMHDLESSCALGEQAYRL